MRLCHDPITHPLFDPSGDQACSPSTELEETNTSQLPTFHPSDLVGQTFLLDQQDDSQCFCARIIQAIKEHDNVLSQNPTHFKFCCSINDDQYEEVLLYNKILSFIEQQDEDGTKIWKFQCIVAHKGPLQMTKPTYKGSKFNIMIEWENGEVTSEPLSIIAADDPVTCALYVRDNNLLELDRWK